MAKHRMHHLHHDDFCIYILVDSNEPNVLYFEAVDSGDTEYEFRLVFVDGTSFEAILARAIETLKSEQLKDNIRLKEIIAAGGNSVCH